MPEGFLICTILSLVLFLLSYLVGVKRKVAFISFFSLVFLKGLNAANKGKIAKSYGVYSVIMAVTFFSLPFSIKSVGELIIWFYLLFILTTTVYLKIIVHKERDS
ncbi:hypothetical protein [Alkalicoccobacillus porphyridii]|uniref:Uncharacterized protein n=1 Tax=Alkalicoccobacillus porphyridii TaxID=2597270 RepID=A0A554A161_9BACI|nr:hypothetical protein [Alkalicoccobacillus porphyridii]TSB47431.1 hypothetical protein FN960_06765 [Alkalicoccobacillus porphyridii]